MTISNAPHDCQQCTLHPTYCKTTRTPRHVSHGMNVVDSSRTSWVHLFTCKRFHVLLNSLFKVLCNFPSRYLFAIGLTAIFSLRWSLPPALGCTLKQPDSVITTSMLAQTHLHRACTRFGISRVAYSKTLEMRSYMHRMTSHETWHRLYTRCVKPFTLGLSLFIRHY